MVSDATWSVIVGKVHTIEIENGLVKEEKYEINM